MVKENALTEYNYGEVKDQENDNVGHLHQSIDKAHCESVIADLRNAAAGLRTERENWKTKYYRTKEKLELSETELKERNG